ncbi:V-type ATPase 116kDa subunit family protein [Actinomadura gamaensis]|uniref:V-type ATPase 116kDa subunit family protein n=1 Tax=Actinomadura gamaensis TaxID=1763541 RepID=A0ABV9TUG3_9ACTN
MRWSDRLVPVRMTRVAVVAPAVRLRDVLAETAASGLVEPDEPDEPDAGPGEPPAPGAAAALLRALGGSGGAVPALGAGAEEPEELARRGRLDLLAGEAQLEGRASAAFRRGDVAAVVGWVPEPDRPALAARLARVGGGAVPLPSPRGLEPPTLLPRPTGADGRTGMRASLAPLVETYGTVPYRDLDPTVPAAVAYVLMFGAMFGDAGHGLMLVAAGALLLAGRPRRAAGLRRAWPFLIGAGAAATLFGFLYGEFFGPTGVVPRLWLDPVDEPVPLLLAATGAGAVLLAGAYAVGVADRLREGGWPLVLYQPSGLAGAAAFLGLGALAAGIYLGIAVPAVLGAVAALAGLGLAFAGFRASSGGGGTGWAQAAVELFDLVTRLGANLLSFARLAAFGLTHAALAAVVWSGTVALWTRGGLGPVAAAALFAAGTALTFSLEALVAGVQALRLEYYELFSRIFLTQGRPFRPWHIPLARQEVDVGVH